MSTTTAIVFYALAALALLFIGYAPEIHIKLERLDRRLRVRLHELESEAKQKKQKENDESDV